MNTKQPLRDESHLTQAQIDTSYEHHCVPTNPYAPSRKYWGRAMQSGFDLARAALEAEVRSLRSQDKPIVWMDPLCADREDSFAYAADYTNGTKRHTVALYEHPAPPSQPIAPKSSAFHAAVAKVAAMTDGEISRAIASQPIASDVVSYDVRRYLTDVLQEGTANERAVAHTALKLLDASVAAPDVAPQVPQDEFSGIARQRMQREFARTDHIVAGIARRRDETSGDPT